MKNSIVLSSILVLVSSCIIGKDARILKKTTEEWRESPLALSGYMDTPMAGVFLYLRENGKFEHTSEFSGFRSFSAGNWTINGDTIQLTYFDSMQNITEQENVLLDREKSQLFFLNDSTPFPMRCTFLSNKL
jgi:hypothetical protein